MSLDVEWGEAQDNLLHAFFMTCKLACKSRGQAVLLASRRSGWQEGKLHTTTVFESRHEGLKEDPARRQVEDGASIQLLRTLDLHLQTPTIRVPPDQDERPEL